VVSGTPAAGTYGTYSYSVKVTDSKGNTATSSNCTLVIAATPIVVVCASANTGQAGVAYSSTVSASGGTGGFTFTITGGALPAGLTMAANGTISGTPSVAGTFSYTVTARDSAGNVGTVSCSLVVNPSALNICGLTWGYWKNHVSMWPITSLVLGSQSYSQTELQTILGLAVKGDQSIEMAHQLIAAKFNVLNGTPIATANGAIAAADGLLSQFSGKLPYSVAASSTVGAQMVTAAGNLNTFNSDGKAQPGCSVTSTGPQGSIGNFVWSDANFNGIQDLGETGIAGVTVKLRDANNNLLATTTTNANGQYDFTNLANGTYVVEIVTPSGYTPTLVGAGGDTGNDSNQNPTIVVLTTGNSSNQSVDFGFYKTSCTGVIGDLVWRDLNGNGIQDTGEPGIAGVALTLKYSGYVVGKRDFRLEWRLSVQRIVRGNLHGNCYKRRPDTRPQPVWPAPTGPRTATAVPPPWSWPPTAAPI